ncbi:MAG: diguanylate cyclase [Synechococcaceae cyanobacterium]|nr:diguanylate cyclase [Synechococcaceae cyanobacterium]
MTPESPLPQATATGDGDGDGDPISLIEELRRTLGRMEAALSAISDSLAITDRQGAVLWCNRAFEQLVGRSRLALLGQPIERLLPADAAGQPLLAGLPLESLDQGASGLRAVLRHDPLLAVAIEWQPVLSEPERPLVFCIRDISAGLSNAAMRLEVVRIARERQALEAQALACAVTGLPNRRALEDRLARACQRLRDGEGTGLLTLLFCDLNGFKQVNDAHGHAAGDALLVTVARRLQSSLRSQDFVARLGGDEFVVLSEGPRSTEEAFNLALRLLEALGQPWRLGSLLVVPSMSVGIAMTDDPELGGMELLRRADLAMYDAKAHVSLPVSLHDELLERRLRQRRTG